MDILQNPIIIGLLLGAITYGYMYWEEQQRHKNNPKVAAKSVSFMTPLVVAVMGWFLASNFFDNGVEAPVVPVDVSGQATGQIEYRLVSNTNNQLPTTNQVAGGQMNTAQHIVPKLDSFELVGLDEVKLPHSDVFIDLARF